MGSRSTLPNLEDLLGSLHAALEAWLPHVSYDTKLPCPCGATTASAQGHYLNLSEVLANVPIFCRHSAGLVRAADLPASVRAWRERPPGARATAAVERPFMYMYSSPLYTKINQFPQLNVHKEFETLQGLLRGCTTQVATYMSLENAMQAAASIRKPQGWGLAVPRNDTLQMRPAPSVLHLSCHSVPLQHGGSVRHFLLLEDEKGCGHLLDAQGLQQMGGWENLGLLVLLACNSEAIARDLPCRSICCTNKVSDSAVRDFCRSFYLHLFSGRSAREAWNKGRYALRNHADTGLRAEAERFLLWPPEVQEEPVFAPPRGDAIEGTPWPATPPVEKHRIQALDLAALAEKFQFLERRVILLTGPKGDSHALGTRHLDTLLTMLSSDEKAKLESSGFATWCIMPHLGCLLLVLALLCVLATQVDRKPRCAMHSVLLVYNGSSIYYHYRMMLVQGQKPLPPPWFREPETFWFNIYALLFSTAVNGVGRFFCRFFGAPGRLFAEGVALLGTKEMELLFEKDGCLQHLLAKMILDALNVQAWATCAWSTLTSLTRNRRWLLVLDGIDRFQSDKEIERLRNPLEDLLCTCTKLCVVLTRRSSGEGPGRPWELAKLDACKVVPFPLSRLSGEDAALLFLDRIVRKLFPRDFDLADDSPEPLSGGRDLLQKLHGSISVMLMHGDRETFADELPVTPDRTLTLEVSLISGKTVSLETLGDESVDECVRRERALGVGKGQLLDCAGSFLDEGAPLKKASLQEGEPLTLQVRRVDIRGGSAAFAAILGDGTVATWGDARSGGDSNAMQAQMKTVQQIQATWAAFAAILGDGSVATWGHAGNGGDSSVVQGGDSSGGRDQLKIVRQIQATYVAFAAILADGSVVT
eukprot:s28_g13.t1